MGYITEEKVESCVRTVIVGAKCDKCQCDLNPIGESGEGASGAMDIILSGGYAQYFDDVNVRVLICKTCADEILAAYPFLRKAMDDQSTL